MIHYEAAPAGAFVMFAIVATSGKQFRVSEGDRILVDHVPVNVGETVRLDSVLMLGGDDRPLVGTPFISGAAVEATVVSHRLGDKVIVFKFEARKRHRRKTGHRQQLSELRIGAIRAPGAVGERSAAGDVAQAASGHRPGTAGRSSVKTRKPAAAAAEKGTQE